jgi:hypothetical protein
MRNEWFSKQNNLETSPQNEEGGIHPKNNLFFCVIGEMMGCDDEGII